MQCPAGMRWPSGTPWLGSPAPTGSCQHLPEAQFHVLQHIQALPQPRIHRSRAGARQPPCLGCLPAPRALPGAGGIAPAPRLMRWLPIPVNHLPGSPAGVHPSPWLLRTRRGALACRDRAPELPRRNVLQQKNPKPHESSRVSCFIVTPNSGFARSLGSLTNLSHEPAVKVVV